MGSHIFSVADAEPPSPKFHGVQGSDEWVIAVFANRVGFDGRSTHVGSAYVIGPNGLFVCRAAEPSLDDAMIIADLEPEMLESMRKSPWYPLKKSRPETYGQ